MLFERKNIITFIFCLLILFVRSQTVTILSSGDLTNNQVDHNRVVVGFDVNATMGVDTTLKENLLDEYSTENNIVCEQRKVDDFECLQDIDGKDIYFYDSRIMNKDLRNLDSSHFFQIKILSNSITEVHIVNENGNDLSEKLEYVGIVRNCGNSGELLVYHVLENFSTIPFSILTFSTNGTLSSIILKFKDNLTSNIELQKEHEISVLPNPFTSQVVVKGLSKIENLRLYDIFGKLVKEFNPIFDPIFDEIRMNLDYLPSGVYFMNYMINGIVMSKKMVKE